MWLSDTHRHINEAIGHIQIWMWPSDTHKHECSHQTYTAIIEAIRHIRIWLWPSDTQIQLWPSDTCRHRNEAIRHTQIWVWPSDKHCYTSGQAPSQTHTYMFVTVRHRYDRGHTQMGNQYKVLCLTALLGMCQNHCINTNLRVSFARRLTVSPSACYLQTEILWEKGPPPSLDLQSGTVSHWHSLHNLRSRRQALKTHLFQELFPVWQTQLLLQPQSHHHILITSTLSLFKLIVIVKRFRPLQPWCNPLEFTGLKASTN